MAKYRVLDGGTATELVRLGYTDIDGDPLWSARLLYTDPGTVKQAHKNFLEAGAMMVVTASYQASIDGFVQHLGLTKEQSEELIKKSVTIAKEACQEVQKEHGGELGSVAGSVGPYGACLLDGSEYTGQYMDTVSLEDLKNWHRPRIRSLLEADPDYLAIESIPALQEAKALVELLEVEFPAAKACVTFTCKNGTQTCHGELLRDAVEAVYQSPVVIATGINCTDPQYITSLLQCLQPLGMTKPIIVKPNSGEQWKPKTGWYGKESAQKAIDTVDEWTKAGATWIGGCCRVYPDDIGALARTLRPSDNTL